MIDRRRFATALGGALALPLVGGSPARRAAAQSDQPEGKIAFVKEGDIWEWSSEDGVRRIIEDGFAMDPTWDPRGDLLLYVRDGGSFSNLILSNPRTGNRKRLTDHESAAEPGSPAYVEGSVWAMDPFWSAADIVCFVSDAESPYREMSLWILLPDDNYAYMAAYDGNDQGPLENPSVDANANFCVYTVLSPGGADGGMTYIAMRDLNMGTTYPLIEGTQGAYDPSISPDSAWIATTIRDQFGVSDLWLFDRVNETLAPLTTDEQAQSSTFSPDGEWIAYLKRDGNGFALKALQIDPDTGERVGDAVTLVDADAIDTASGLSWGPI